MLLLLEVNIARWLVRFSFEGTVWPFSEVCGEKWVEILVVFPVDEFNDVVDKANDLFVNFVLREVSLHHF